MRSWAGRRWCKVQVPILPRSNGMSWIYSGRLDGASPERNSQLGWPDAWSYELPCEAVDEACSAEKTKVPSFGVRECLIDLITIHGPLDDAAYPFASFYPLVYFLLAQCFLSLLLLVSFFPNAPSTALYVYSWTEKCVCNSLYKLFSLIFFCFQTNEKRVCLLRTFSSTNHIDTFSSLLRLSSFSSNRLGNLPQNVLTYRNTFITFYHRPLPGGRFLWSFFLFSNIHCHVYTFALLLLFKHLFPL